MYIFQQFIFLNELIFFQFRSTKIYSKQFQVLYMNSSSCFEYFDTLFTLSISLLQQVEHLYLSFERFLMLDLNPHPSYMLHMLDKNNSQRLLYSRLIFLLFMLYENWTIIISERTFAIILVPSIVQQKIAPVKARHSVDSI